MNVLGFRPLFLHNDFMFRSASFIGSLEGGVVLLFEFFFAPSYFSSRLRNERFSACNFFHIAAQVNILRMQRINALSH